MRREFRDPATGDPLTLAEEVSWIVQGMIRRWTFLILFTLLTAAVWWLGSNDDRTWWNLAASYLAILIEGTVGIAMFSATRRDAVILREIRKAVQHLEAQSEHMGVEPS